MIANVATAYDRTGMQPTNYAVYPLYAGDRRPRMLYRGHAIRVGRPDEDPYQQHHAVNRYQMHSLHAGFSGCANIPLKDQNNYKVPLQRSFSPRTPSGKWANYPMTIEIGKYTRGIGRKYLSSSLPPISKEKPKSLLPSPGRSRTSFSLRGSVDFSSRPLPSPLDFASDMRLYEEIQPEIIDIMAARNEVFLSFQSRVESALMNDNDPISNPPSRLGFTSNNDNLPAVKPTPQPRPKTSIFVDGPNTNLLLPVPFIMPNNKVQSGTLKMRSNSAPIAVSK